MNVWEVRLECLKLAQANAGRNATTEQILKDAAELARFVNSGAESA